MDLRRVGAGVAICLGLMAAPLTAGPAQARSVVDSYCSPTGDYCVAVERRQGRIKFVLRTFSFRGNYEVCVKPPKHRNECLTTELFRVRHGIFASKVDFARNFFHRSRGRYLVSWHYEGFRVGKVLHFRRHR